MECDSYSGSFLPRRCLFACLFESSDHQTRLFREIVPCSLQQRLHAAQRVGERYECTWIVGIGFGDKEGLRQEALELTGAEYHKALLGGEFGQSLWQELLGALARSRVRSAGDVFQKDGIAHERPGLL